MTVEAPVAAETAFRAAETTIWFKNRPNLKPSNLEGVRSRRMAAASFHQMTTFRFNSALRLSSTHAGEQATPFPGVSLFLLLLFRAAMKTLRKRPFATVVVSDRLVVWRTLARFWQVYRVARLRVRLTRATYPYE